MTMKTLQLLSPILLMGILLISACGGDDKETAEQAFLKQIAGNWRMTKADFDGKDVMASFAGLALSVSTSKAISVQNSIPPMWQPSSTFILEKSGSSFALRRNDGLLISVDQVTDTKLILSFLYDAIAMGGRVGSVTGGFTFEFEAD
jgi:hypothetical protein